jgi:mono/diheme cytochrome c family protein
MTCTRPATMSLCALLAAFSMLGCSHVPGRPGPGVQVVRPEEVLEFSTLYKTNCAACHGANGVGGAAISLANPVYLAFAGEDTLRQVTANGVHGKLMPAFAKSAGGTLTDQQVSVLAHGMMQKWGNPDLVAAPGLPAYKATREADVAHGQQEFATFCASCHGAGGEGNAATVKKGETRVGSIVDEAYLDLISDQALRSFVIAGRPHQGMPDWRSDGPVPMTDQQITDIVAWMASKRTATPGQPYPVRP